MMRGLPIRAVLLALALQSVGGCETGRVSMAPTISKIEARQMGEQDAERVVLDQLYDILIPSPFQETRRPRNRLSDMWFATRGRATSVVDLCRIDVVNLEFEPVEPDRGAETQVRVSGVNASPRFYFLSEPTSPEPNRSEWNGDARCARTDRFDDPYFSAADEVTAVSGYWRALAVLDSYGAGSASYELVCDDSRTSCQDQVARAQANGLSELERCISERCTIATFGDIQLRIYQPADYWDPDRDRVVRVEVHELIVMVHERID